MSEKPRLARQAMCDRLAMEFQDNWIVNLGVGMTLCSNYVDPQQLIFHSENGVIGYGPGAYRRGRPLSGQRRWAVCHGHPWHGHRAPCRFLCFNPQRHGGCGR